MDVDDFDDRGQAVFVVTLITFLLATVFVVARLLSRFLILRHRTWDDWFIILSWFLAFGVSFAICYGAKRGLGRHAVNVPQNWLPAYRRSLYAFTILYNPALMASKTSVLIFYLRMSKNTQNLLRKASYATLLIVNLDGVVLTFINAFQCNPVTAAYNGDVSAKCMSIVTLYLCSAPVNIVVNLAILVLPLPVLTGMRLPTRQKVILVLTFSLGFFVTIVDVVRIFYLQKASDNRAGVIKLRLGDGPDFSWNASTALMWSAVEVNVGIICACIPTLKPLFKIIFPAMITGRYGTGSVLKSSSLHHRGSDSMPSQRHDDHSDSPVMSPMPPIHLTDSKEDIGMLDFLTGRNDFERTRTRSNATDGMGFLTAPAGFDSGHMPTLTRTHTQGTSKTVETTYFGFVNMKRPRSMLKTTGWHAFHYNLTVTILFFLWGFSYGLLNILNAQIAFTARETDTQRLGLSCAYFVGYLFGPLTVGQWVLRHGGFKATFICGICIYGVATLMFWPSAVLKSFPGFLICSFVVGFGLAVLETAANPFIALCGPAQYAEYRLLLAQGVQAVGTVLSQLIAQKALFNDLSELIDNDTSLVDIQWTYLGVALFSVLLALFFYYMPLPEAKDSDLQQLSENLSIFPSETVTPLRLPLLWTTLGLAVFAQYVYVAAQESNSTWFPFLLSSAGKTGGTFSLTTDEYTLIALTAFALGRFIFAALCLIIPPRILLLVSFAMSVLFAVLTSNLKTLTADGLAALSAAFFFFEGPIWPLIFAIGLRGMGSRTKWAASLLTTGASGGAASPFVMYAIQKVHKKSVQYSYCVVVALMAFGLIFPIYLNLFKNSRHQVDPAQASSFGDQQLDDVSEIEEPTQNPLRRASLKISSVLAKFGKGNSIDLPMTEHREML